MADGPHHGGVEPGVATQARLRLDLGIGMAVLAAASNGTDLPSAERLSRWMFVGELGLDGSVRPVGSVLPAALAARGRCRLLRRPGGKRAGGRAGQRSRGAAGDSLQHLWALLRGEAEPASDPGDDRWEPERSLSGSPSQAAELDLADVRGQEPAKRALAIAAAGGHHLCLVGPAGVGKTMLASRLPSLLPTSTMTTPWPQRRSPPNSNRIARRSWSVVRRSSAPHHTSTDIARWWAAAAERPRIGLVTRAHAGVLLLDEAAEFSAGCSMRCGSRLRPAP